MLIKRLHIQKMPGFPHGLKAYEDIADHINVIAGANGTGKSSTARVIQKLIWWDGKQNLNIVADLLIENLPHQVKIDYPFYYHTDPQGNRSTEDFRTYVSESFEKQYILALHDLVKGDDENLAKEIIKEVNGGFDLYRAAGNLAYGDGIFKTTRSEHQEYQEARKAYNEITNEQESLKSKALQLERLREEVRKAKEAKDRKKYYENLIAWMQIRETQEKNKEQLTSFSPILEYLRPDDWENIQLLESKITEQQNEISRLEQHLIENQSGLKILAVPEEGFEEVILDELEHFREELREKKRSLDKSREKILRLKVAQEQAALAISLTEEPQGEVLSLEDLRAVESMTREANQVEGELVNISDRRRVLEAEIAEQKDSIKNYNQDTETLNKGITELSRWLKQEAVPYSMDSKFIVLQTILGLLTAVSVGLWGWFGLVGVLIMLAVLTFEQIEKRKHKQKNLAVSEAYYQELGLESPLYWDSKQVTVMLDELIGQHRRISYLNELQRQEKELNALWFASKEKWSVIERKYQDLIDRLNIRMDRFKGETERYNIFYYFIRELIQWQDASTALKEEQTLFEQLQAEYNEILTRGNNYFSNWGKRQVDTWEAFDAQVKEFRKLSEKQKELLNRIRTSEATLAQNEKQKKENQIALQTIYKRLTLEEGAKDKVQDLVAQLNDYEAVRKYLNETAAILADRRRELEKSSFFQSDEIKGITIDEALRISEQYGKEAESYEKLLEEVTGIELKINQAQEGNTLEMAIARRDSAFNGLHDTFDLNLQSVTGSLIVDQLRQEISLNNENRVFREANNILGDITRQRYGLILSDVKESAFKAVDHRSGQVLTLEELSTGTRVQLLLAIRLAYIQSMEKSIRLPILADELLANSDDQRSEAIIRSLIEISKKRQVFYFTAQGDEVGKWKSYLDAAEDIRSKIFILGEESESANIYRSEIRPVLLFKDIPEPNDLSYGAYGKLLQVPPFNLLEYPVKNLHLWYLFDDTGKIYNYLRRGITRWGQLEQLREKGDPGDLTNDEWNLLQQKIELIKEFISLYRRGRPKKVDKEVIIRSGAISDKFIEKVFSLLDECEGDPLILLQSLPSVPRLQKSKIEDLNTYLLENNYIDGNEVLTPEEIQISLQAKISELKMDIEEAHKQINLLTAEPIFKDE